MSTTVRRPRTVQVPSPTAGAARRAVTVPPLSDELTSQLARGTDTQSAQAASESQASLALLERKLERAIETIAMHVQPIVVAASAAPSSTSTSTTRIGYEALLRTTDTGLPHPGAVFDAATRLERIPQLGRAIRAQVAQIIGAAPDARGLVFLNVHPLELHDRHLTSTFAPLTKVARRVVLEIGEAALAGDGRAEAVARIGALRELGFRIALDDARPGTTAALDTVSRAHADFLKLDMTLVRDIARQASKQLQVRAIIERCHAEGIQVIGQGVETVMEVQTLLELGCDLLQGYAIARPTPPFSDPL